MWCYSGPHFPAFGLNTEEYSYLSVFSPNAKNTDHNNPNADTFHAVIRFVNFRVGNSWHWKSSEIVFSHTAWKCTNTEFFLVRIQFERGKIRTRWNSLFGHFSRSVTRHHLNQNLNVHIVIFCRQTSVSNMFLDRQCYINREEPQHKILNWQPLLHLLRETIRIQINSEATVQRCKMKNGKVLKSFHKSIHGRVLFQ